MDVLIIYDIKSDPHDNKNDEVKDGMKALGYLDYFLRCYQGIMTRHYLPNTSLWKSGISLEQAELDINNVAKKFGAVIERLFVTQIGKNTGIPGLAYKEKKKLKKST